MERKNSKGEIYKVGEMYKYFPSSKHQIKRHCIILGFTPARVKIAALEEEILHSAPDPRPEAHYHRLDTVRYIYNMVDGPGPYIRTISIENLAEPYYGETYQMARY